MMTMRNILLSALMVFVFVSAHGQMGKRNKTDVFPLDSRYKLGGFVIGAGITYTQGYLEESEFYNYEDTLGLVSYNYYGDPKGKIGGFLEVNWFHSFKNPRIFHYMDFGVSYKYLRGLEEFTEQVWVDNTMLAENNIDNTFNDHLLSVNFNLTNQTSLSERVFMTNAIGLNADYFLITSRGGGAIFPEGEDKSPSGINAQLHYKFGIGWQASKKLLIIPTIETPILGLYPFTHIKSTLDYFNTRFRPFLIGVRFMFIREGGQDCPPVYNPMGINPAKYRNRNGDK